MAASERGRGGWAVVTGASGGIGLELARLLAQDGHDLVLAARSADRLAGAAAELTRDCGVRAEAVVVDLSRPGEAERLAGEVRRRGPGPEVLVNNAGVGLHGRFADSEPDRLGDLLQLNVASLTALTRALLPGMLEQGRGRILNVASTAGFAPGPFMAAYYASKAYVLSFSVALGEELSGTGVTVTALCPGATRTGFGAAAGVSRARYFRSPFVMDALAVARAGHRAMKAGRAVVVPGLANKALATSSHLGPRWLVAKVARTFQDPADMA